MSQFYFFWSALNIHTATICYNLLDLSAKQKPQWSCFWVPGAGTPVVAVQFGAFWAEEIFWDVHSIFTPLPSGICYKLLDLSATKKPQWSRFWVPAARTPLLGPVVAVHWRKSYCCTLSGEEIVLDLKAIFSIVNYKSM